MLLLKLMFKNNLPTKIPIFPLKNLIIFPKTAVPLNIFEPRYIDMINDSMKSDKLIGMIQPLSLNNIKKTDPDLHQVGCLGKIISFKETENQHYLIELKGIIRFEIINEIKSKKKYRECEVNFERYIHDLNNKEQLKFSDLELIFKDLKTLFEKRGFIINWKELEKQSLDETINALAMASPFTLEEKQVLLEAENLDIRKNKIADILKTYTHDFFDNTTLQ